MLTLFSAKSMTTHEQMPCYPRILLALAKTRGNGLLRAVVTSVGGQVMAPVQTEETHAGVSYERLLEWLRDHRALVVLGAGALLVASLLVAPSNTSNGPCPDLTEDETPLFI